LTERQPEPRESSESGAFLRIEKPHGAVEVWALGGDQFSVRAPAWDDTVITGFDVARATAHRLARALE
jgi:hypothetical protein